MAILSATSPAFAQKRWVGPHPDNDWFTAANWNPTGAPALTDDTGIGNGTQATIALPGATTQNLDIGVLSPGTLNVNGTGELTANGNVTVGAFDDGTLNITGGGTVRHPGFDGIISDAGGVMGVATVDGALSNWLLHNLFVGKFGHGTLNILNGGKVTGFDAFIAQNDNATGLAVVNGAGGASTLQLGGNLFVGGDSTGPHGTGVLRVLNGGIVNSNRLVVLSTGTLEIGANPMITVTNPLGIEYDAGTLKTIADTTLTNNGSLQTGGVILDSNGFDSTLGGIYSGAGGLSKIGAGSVTLTGHSTYTGDTNISGGTLFVDGIIESNTFVLPGGTLGGTGDIFGASVNNNGVVSPGHNSVGLLQIIGNYTQLAGGTLHMEIGGTTIGASDFLGAGGGGQAFLAGTLSLARVNNYNPMVGDQVPIIATTLGVHNRFDNVVNDFSTLVQPRVIYGADDVRIVFVQGSFQLSGLTPNQKAVARNLNDSIGDPAAITLINFLDTELIAALPHDYDLIAPEELAAIYEIGFSQAVVQNNNLQRRMDDIRAGSNGFCANNFVAHTSGKEDVSKGADGKVVLPSKDGPEVYIPTENNRWGVFINGSGDFVNVNNNDLNAHGYDIATGDFTVGADYRLCDHFAIGIDAGYSRSTADLVDDGRVEVDGGKIGAYATLFGKGLFGSKFYVDGGVGGGLNNYDTRRTGLQDELVRGNTDGTEFNAFIAYGSDWTFGCFNIGTWSTVQYTNVSIDRFTETGSLAPLVIEDQDENSFRATTGVHASYDIKTGHAIFRPEVRVAYQHEYCDSAYQIDSQLASGAGGVFRVRGPNIGRDAALLGAGMNMQWNNRLSTYVYYDGVLGRNNYDNNAVSGGFRIGF
ncbi:MAG TPA: autotransporter domain-containing protein [Chthoniobacterales bacterium]|nr:autotransporter domain-containing protein [Chthoniobacterales bacterium]